MLSLQQKMSLQQKLSPQQIQYQKLLQLNNLAMEQRIKTELEMNPVLEEVPELEQLESDLNSKNDDNDSNDRDDFDEDNPGFDIDDYVNEEDLEFARVNRSADDEHNAPIAPQRDTLTEHLLEQLQLLNLSEIEQIIGENIIWSLDNDGYLGEELPEIIERISEIENITIPLEKAEEILYAIQRLDPIGIASRSLQECLVLQMEESSFDPFYKLIAEKILKEEYENFTNKRFDLIKKNLQLTEDSIRVAIKLIQKLNPKPGEGNISSELANQITPDFIIEKVDNNYIITLNDRLMPSVTISQAYVEMLDEGKKKKKKSEPDKEANKFLKEKIDSAKWFIFSIEQRRQTLIKIMKAIFEKQREYFEYGARALKPMIYKDIADRIEMDISTVSRVVRGKYVQSIQGINELKFFFSEGLQTDGGDEISNKHIKELIKEICENEPTKKPYSDDKIAKILQGKGIHIARRTVAKYREQLGVPVARLRKGF